MSIRAILTQKTLTGSKLSTKTLEKGVKYVQSYQRRHQNDVTGILLCVFTVNFEHTSHLSMKFLVLTMSKYLFPESK